MSRHRATPSRSRSRRTAVVTGAGLVAALLGAGIAVAAWTSTGDGAATAKAGTAQAPTTSDVQAFTSGLLYPGGTGDVMITINNPNPYPVRVASIVAGAGPIGVSGAAGECTDHGVTFTPPAHVASDAGLDSKIAAASSLTLTLPAAVSMASTANDGCQGAVFGIPVTVTVVSG
jgi:hypothetical protein